MCSRPQCFETGTQSQEKNWKEFKHLDAKDHPSKECWLNQEIKEELKQFIETNENETTSVQNLLDTAKAVLRGKYIAIQASLKKAEKSQMHKLTLHLKELEKEQ